MKIEPITKQERVHCALCAKPLQPQHRCRKTFYSSSMEANGRTPEEQLAEYRTNKRIVRIARSYTPVHHHVTGDVIDRKVHRIEVVHMPEAEEWGLWGKFCGVKCAASFGYHAHGAGYRIKRGGT